MTPFFPVKPSTFLFLGFKVRNREDQYDRRCFRTLYDHFRAHYGVSPSTCALLWRKVSSNRYILPLKGQPEYLLWALLYLKVYSSEKVLADKVGVDVKTFCKWSWAFVEAIAKLKPQVVRDCCDYCAPSIYSTYVLLTETPFCNRFVGQTD